jgi:hypothetical protein
MTEASEDKKIEVEEIEELVLALSLRDIAFFQDWQHILKPSYFFEESGHSFFYECQCEFVKENGTPITQTALIVKIKALLQSTKKLELFELKYKAWEKEVERIWELPIEGEKAWIEKTLPQHIKEIEIRSEISKAYATNDIYALSKSEGLKKAIELDIGSSNGLLARMTLAKDVGEDNADPWLVDKLIPRCAVTILYSKGGLGKSHLAWHLGNCVQDGEEFLGLEVKQCPVYYIDYENPLPVRIHLKEVLGGGEMKILPLEENPPPIDSQEFSQFEDLPPGLIIIDTFAAAHMKKISIQGDDAAPIMNKLKRLWAKGHTVIVLLHTLKANEREYKGPVEIVNLADHVLAMFQVKHPGDTTEDDAENDPNTPKNLFFGCGQDQKSRFEKSTFYLKFDPQKGFERVQDKDEPFLKDIHQRLVEHVHELKKVGRNKPEDYPDWGTFVTIVTSWEEVGKSKAKLLIKKGEPRYWGKDKIKVGRQFHDYYFPKIRVQE